MDQFLNLAKQGYQAYSESQGNVSKTGGEEYNAPSHSNQGDYQQGGQGFRPNIDHQAAANHASQNSGEDSGIFHNAVNHVLQSQNHPNGMGQVNEQHITSSHQGAYDSDGNVSNNASNMDASQLGSAAAMQALKSFTSGGGGSGGGGGGQTQLISMAMSEASKLFDSSNGGGGGDKQAVVTSAAMTVMKLLAQQGGGSSGGGGGGMLGMAESMIGGGNSGGLGPLKMMSMASKFM